MSPVGFPSPDHSGFGCFCCSGFAQKRSGRSSPLTFYPFGTGGLYYIRVRNATLRKKGTKVVSCQLSVASPQSPTPNPHAEAEACFHKALWFTEGFDTADLQAAKALLDTLAREVKR
jgi:hypothetical protein